MTARGLAQSKVINRGDELAMMLDSKEKYTKEERKSSSL